MVSGSRGFERAENPQLLLESEASIDGAHDWPLKHVVTERCKYANNRGS